MYTKLHNAALTELLLPLPCAEHCVFDGLLCSPAEDFVGFLGIGPNLLDVTSTAAYNLVGNFNASGFFKCIDKLEHRDAVAGTDIVIKEGDIVEAFTMEEIAR